MSNFDSLPQIIFPNETFTKKWDTLIITGEVFRASVHEKQVKNSANGNYEISVKLSPDSFKQLKQMKLDSSDKDGKPLGKDDRALTGLKKVDLTKKDENGNAVLDDMGDPVKEFSHYQITTRQRATITKDGVETKVTLPVVMASDNSIVDGFLQEGSKVSILVQAYETIFRDKPAMGLNLKEVKVHEAILYEGGSGGSHSDPWAALGLTSAVVEKAAQEAPEQQQESGASSEPSFDDFDDTDSIPF